MMKVVNGSANIDARLEDWLTRALEGRMNSCSVNKPHFRELQPRGSQLRMLGMLRMAVRLRPTTK